MNAQIKLGRNGIGTIELDGMDIANAVASFTLRSQPGKPTKLTLDINAVNITQLEDEDVRIYLPDETIAALIYLGWTPPAATTEPADDASPALPR